MVGNKRKVGTLEGKRRNKGAIEQVDVSILSNENSSAMSGAKRKKSVDERKRNKNMDEQVDSSNVSKLENAVGRKKKDDVSRKKKKHNNQKIQPMVDEIGEGTPDENEILEQNQMEKAFGRNRKDEALRKNKKKRKVQKIIPEEEQKCDDNVGDGMAEGNIDEDEKLEQKQRKSKKKKKRNVTRTTDHNMGMTEKACEAEEYLQTKGDLEKKEDEDEVYQIPSEDENSSQGMRKWITNYYQSRPGLKVLQENIDEFITAHEAQEEQARIEKEEQAAEGGWTVVVHHKGRKKTTDVESGIAVGSVAQAAVIDKMTKKKNKDVGLDFYRFQKREANRNEIMMLQSKFEQDKKRLQELRAQRKFRPY